MKKSLLYRWFRLGAIPRKLRPVLAAEGIVIDDEGMGGWFIARDVRAPGRRYWHRREYFAGSLVVTSQRILAYTYHKRQINIATDDPMLPRLFVSLPGPGILKISFESADFRDNWHGVLACVFKTDRARAFHEALTSMGVQDGEAAREGA